MSVFICKMCGAPLNFSEGSTVCECSYCGTAQTVSVNQDEVNINMFNRANNLRMKSEFDRAYAQYEKLILNRPDDAEGYWGLILSKFGVEYVKDPATGRMVPTLHRTQAEPVLTDPDYRSVLEYANPLQRPVYEQAAKEIDKIQKEVMAVVQNESPYDVFICYKEKDENDSRTQDSVIANDIYYQLTQEGLKVFYAAITLENKLGHEYEPYIYAALHSAKVMLVIGTRPEFFEAVWVKNEWSRYLKIVQEDRNKLLIPCYRDMNPYDLPAEFSHLQSYNMSKIGFISEIIRAIRKALNGKSAPVGNREYDISIDRDANINIDNILLRGDIALQDGEWSEAEGFFNRVLNADAEEYRAYIGLLCAEMKVNEEKDLLKMGDRISESKSYQRACRFGGSEVEKRLKGYVAQHDYNAKSEMYNDAVARMQEAETSSDYYELMQIFESLGDFKDSEEKYNECCDLAQEKVETEEEEYWDAIRNSEVGDVVGFGDYDWIVLERKDNQILLLAETNLNQWVYHTEYVNVTWEKCDLRKWLNDEFYNEFIDEDKEVICKTKITTPGNPEFLLRFGGKPTEDYFFLLSVQEARKLDPKILSLDKKWWLRTPGMYMDLAAYVRENGEISTVGEQVTCERCENEDDREGLGIRPAVYIKIDA